MNYLAVFLCADGGIIRNDETGEVMNMEVGDLDTQQQAIVEACTKFDCEHLRNGVIRKRSGAGGFLIVDAQEFVEV
ncbi:hypothetical protein PTW35_06815 [Photobacterium sp. DA100]|uniref:Uncharacterized protein n=1 Tax=Photobacterium rosenbergii TaxID=294936 RepID=A0A2T3NHF7_9GAMM|nr:MULTISPECIES: hypothetical protein [Photobacterium]PSW14400.1 hypothetical protein C9J01_08150 [Photobacterium rosenbergii]WEM43497.1 hypothetical protein PTW35_06815 [Photobacterium sp. DA100]